MRRTFFFLPIFLVDENKVSFTRVETSEDPPPLYDFTTKHFTTLLCCRENVALITYSGYKSFLNIILGQKLCGDSLQLHGVLHQVRGWAEVHQRRTPPRRRQGSGEDARGKDDIR